MTEITVGKKLKQEREKRNLSLREFARRLGIAASYLVDIEKGRRIPSEEIIQKAADLLDIPTSNFDEFSPEIPKPVKKWLEKNPLVERILKCLKKTPYPEKVLENFEKCLSFSSTDKFFIAVYESELQAIGVESSSWDRETGGDLFGIWGDIPVIYLATRTGPNTIRDQSHFRLDVDYLIKLSAELQRDWGLRYFGDWHSHHRLGLDVPSGEDRNRIERIASKNNFHEMVEFIVTFSSSYDTNNKICIHPYVYKGFFSLSFNEAILVVLKGMSPVREALVETSQLPEQQLESFSSFPLESIVIPREPLARVPGKEGLPIEQISEKAKTIALSELAKISSEEIELHQTAFGHIIVIPVNGHENIAFAIDRKWPHKVLQVNWMDRSSGNTEELPLEKEDLASLVNIQELKKVFLMATNLKKKASQ